MKHAVIFSHPRAHGFTADMAHAYADAVKAEGHQVLIRDLYRMHFDPRLHAQELPDAPASGPRPDVVAERTLLADVDCFALFYPLWFNAPPAMMKGYIDRVFSMGFGYGHEAGLQLPKLVGRKLFVFTSSGASTAWLHQTGGYNALYVTSDRHFAEVCGLTFVEHTHFGEVVPGYTPEAIRIAEQRVRDVVTRYFSKTEA